MNDQIRRSKMISLRLPEEDYEALKKQYRSHGASSVSDLARLAIHDVIHKSPHNDFEGKLASFEERLRALETFIGQSLEPEKTMV